MSEWLNNIFGVITACIGQIILVILALITFRDILARFLFIPRKWKISRWIYTQYEKDTLLEIFRLFGIDENKFRRQIRSVKNNNKIIAKPEEKLVYLLSKYTYNFTTEYGIQTPTKTDYYINTMEASHFSDDLDTMTDLISCLINRQGGDLHQDFIISPKCGNPMLGQNYTTLYNNIFLLSKYEKDKSRSKNNNPLISLMINFEGFAALKMEAESNSNRDYKGYVIDCNLSGGSLILKPMVEFNNMLNQLHQQGDLLNIKPLTEAFILFRADTDIASEGKKFDEVFEENGFKCHRFFDLDEENKSSLYSYKNKKDIALCKCLSNKRDNFLSEFINKLKCKELLKID